MHEPYTKSTTEPALARALVDFVWEAACHVPACQWSMCMWSSEPRVSSIFYEIDVKAFLRAQYDAHGEFYSEHRVTERAKGLFLDDCEGDARWAFVIEHHCDVVFKNVTLEICLGDAAK